MLKVRYTIEVRYTKLRYNIPKMRYDIGIEIRHTENKAYENFGLGKGMVFFSYQILVKVYSTVVSVRYTTPTDTILYHRIFQLFSVLFILHIFSIYI